MATEDDRTITVQFEQDVYDRLMAVSVNTEALFRKSGMN